MNIVNRYAHPTKILPAINTCFGENAMAKVLMLNFASPSISDKSLNHEITILKVITKSDSILISLGISTTLFNKKLNNKNPPAFNNTPRTIVIDNAAVIWCFFNKMEALNMPNR